jgi:phospholipid-binding lipoprotein MlaA
VVDLPVAVRHFAARAVGLAALAGVLAGCAAMPNDPQVAAARVEANDPIEPFNRWIFDINEGFDLLLLKPVAVIYREVVPDPLRDNVRNVLTNLRAPVSVANDVLQGDVKGAGDTAARFLVNSTIGFAGLADVASEIGKPPRDEDFGQTLAVWGVGEGPYVVLPLLGPSTVRDTAGLVVDGVADPVNIYLRNNDLNALVFARAGLSAVDTRSRLIEVIDDLKVNSIDYYATVRSLYRQRRNDQIRDGVGTGDEFPVFDDQTTQRAPGR